MFSMITLLDFEVGAKGQIQHLQNIHRQCFSTSSHLEVLEPKIRDIKPFQCDDIREV